VISQSVLPYRRHEAIKWWSDEPQNKSSPVQANDFTKPWVYFAPEA
jgi:hypothetical protein